MSARPRVVIAGVSTRAAAESAARAGFPVTAIDAFADLDQHPSVRALSVSRRVSASLLARAARDIECDAVVYLSPFENHPRALAALASGRTLWGNPPAVLERVRDPITVANLLRGRGFVVPLCVARPLRAALPTAGPTAFATASALEKLRATPVRWLVKLIRSGGGRGVRPWQRDDVPRGCYLQELIAGTPGSVIFVADGTRAMPLGVMRQLIGEAAFGASGYQYCGNILAASDDPQSAGDDALMDAAGALARAAAEEFGLVGINGIDFVVQDGIPWPVEINPRWCASVELVERAYGVSAFELHAAACDSGTLGAVDVTTNRTWGPASAGPAPIAREAFGKAVVFARQNVTIGDTRIWLEEARGDNPGIRDIPRRGERIGAGSPVCTVLASASDANACRAALVQRAERVYARLAVWETETRVL